MDYKYVLRIRNNGFRNNEIDDMGICIMTNDRKDLDYEIKKALYCGNIDFHVEVNQVEEE